MNKKILQKYKKIKSRKNIFDLFKLAKFIIIIYLYLYKKGLLISTFSVEKLARICTKSKTHSNSSECAAGSKKKSSKLYFSLDYE